MLVLIPSLWLLTHSPLNYQQRIIVIAMSSTADDDDLTVSTTAGYKVGEKKTLEELQKLDEQDESLKKWKESLGIKAGASEDADTAKDPRKVIVFSLTLEVKDRTDVVVDISTPEKLAALKEKPLTIKEGCEYRLKIKFKVQHEVISGLKYLHSVKRMGVRVDKAEEMLGSYGPAPEPYEKKFLWEEAPAGMMARAHYSVKSKFVDDDNFTHMEWDWSFDIKKDWD
ncbi:hypothetical protein SmJEL517_g04172 [Synchytrium microbalum]|uniref:Rho GDP-dissociation inhibitor n=1 Tax=Synchytrium microbalum TaxID=1806994 RepID=A0A507C065_9FUNG|nr:uncharacterized protein SmJEL517_g04172 [Synchytrium microbalum]TPX32791.1 hypothetical protein SmJEL517_g04172 [Synchytrium microbalum]